MPKAWIPANILDLRRFATLTSVTAQLAGVFIAALFLTFIPPVVAREFSIYAVSNMPVDETAESAAAAREIALANAMIVMAMNAGMASTFPPFYCRD